MLTIDQIRQAILSLTEPVIPSRPEITIRDFDPNIDLTSDFLNGYNNAMLERLDPDLFEAIKGFIDLFLLHMPVDCGCAQRRAAMKARIQRALKAAAAVRDRLVKRGRHAA